MRRIINKRTIAPLMLSMFAASSAFSATAADTGAGLNDTSSATTPGHRSLPAGTVRTQNPVSGTTADKAPDALNPATNASASGMGTTDNTMSSATGSEATRIGR